MSNPEYLEYIRRIESECQALRSQLEAANAKAQEQAAQIVVKDRKLNYYRNGRQSHIDGCETLGKASSESMANRCTCRKIHEEQIADLTARLEGGGEPVAWMDVYGRILHNSLGNPVKPQTNTDVQRYSIPLNTTPPTTSAAVAAALMKAAEACELIGNAGEGAAGEIWAERCSKAILALPHDKTALREVCLQVAEEVTKVIVDPTQKWRSSEALVDEIIGGVE